MPIVRFYLAQNSVFTERHGGFRRSIIIAARHGAGMTQQGLADKLGRLQSYVSKFERGKRRLNVLEFVNIATALKTAQHLLLDGLRKKNGTE